MAGLLDLFVSIGIKDNASSKIESVTKKAVASFGKIGSVAGKGLAVAAKGAVVAAGAVATLSTMAVKSYAEYEQLVGGVKTLFGASEQSFNQFAKASGLPVKEATAQYAQMMAAQKAVMENADEAYKTAGLSANDYMETVTGFAAALNSSLGGNTLKSAQYADMAVKDMADNSNKMGTNMQSIQNAYQGFAKQNYTMLDNLKLGYGGTKQEMERLLQDAGKLAGKKFDISSYADVVEAIHTVQTEMGITGTTAKEAEHTISGSVNSMKAAWTNWLTGLGNSDADIQKLTGELVTSAKTVMNNIMPVVSQVLSTLGEVITEDAPGIVQEALTYFLDAAPELLSMGGELISALVNGIIQNLPQISQAATQIISMLCNGIMENVGQLPGTITQLVQQLVTFIVENAPQLLATGVVLILAIVEGLIESIPALVEAVPQLIDGLVTAFSEAAGTITAIGSKIVADIKAGISSAWEGLKSWFKGIWDSLFGNLSVNVGVNYSSGSHSGRVGKFAIGTDYVPFNDMPALLHRGEAVLNAYEADQWRRGRSGESRGTTINQYIQSVPQTPVQLAEATAAYFAQARWM